VTASENPNFHSASYFLWRQLLWAAAGLAAMFLLASVPYRGYDKPGIVFPLLGCTLILLAAVFFLDPSHHTHRWMRAGPLSFQPSELAKLALILFLAWFLAPRTKLMDDWRALLGSTAVTVVLAVLVVVEPDLGTAIILAAIAAVMLFVAGMRLRYYLYPLPLVPPLFYFLVYKVPWRWARVLAFFNSLGDSRHYSFHILQSLIAVGTGGFAGTGLMEGKQKLFFLPEAHTDFIFAVIAEEWGLLGALTVIGFYGLFCYRGLRLAMGTRDPFTRLLATGITSMVVIQALLNVSVVLGMLPAKGIPLPLISYGGSSLFVTLAAIGVLLNITRYAG
jgi:cell division protein FtsW